ncbi:MAG: FixH family protein [Rhodospirillales bacterium]
MQRLSRGLILAATLTLGCAGAIMAAVDDYIFQAVPTASGPGGETLVGVRLVNKASGKPVADAVIFQTRIDMSPDGMGEMTGKLTPLPSEETGLYRFRADTGMAGRWAVKLAAKVPGESETVRGEVIVVIPPTR